MLLFFGAYYVSAQNVPLHRNHSLQEAVFDLKSREAPDSLTIIAIRVSFQPDENRLTSGDGTFAQNSLPYLQNNNITIDPLPHNRAYFEAHLEFAKNYFTKASANNLSIRYRVLPDIYQLDNTMEFYSPTGETFSNEKLAFLARDAWQEVEEGGGFDTSSLDPEKTAFIIFHAGVGRDIELTGTTLDITPQDIPSLTLSRKSLAKLLNDPGFDGFPVNNGSFRVSNSLILPRTLSRRGEDFTGQEFVLQLSINGLICASLGSFLGLPDLFNTRTGSSGIGRFGLMDGESFFSYRGLFPPEPSAWEKTRLGWQDAFIINTSEQSEIQLPAATLNEPGSIARYSLSGEEYFLVENRHRDPNNNGVTLTIRTEDGSLAEQSFSNDDNTFVNQGQGFEELFTPGVLVNVDNFDWSLPGGLDAGADGEPGTNDDRFLNGGILIWHIDEGVIRREIEGQTVNANPERRGVDLEEADGPQDIGRAANDNFANQARGWAFDFWWSGNNASVVTLQDDTLSLYQNRFAYDTTPSNRSNSGARSYFELFDFSDNLPVASFKIRPVSGDLIKPISLTDQPVPGQNTFIKESENYRINYPLGLNIYTPQSDTFLIIPSSATVYALQLNAKDGGFFDFGKPQPQQPYIGEKVILANNPSDISSIELGAWTWDGSQWQNSWMATAPANRGFLSSLEDDTLLMDFTRNRFLTADGSPVPNLSLPRQSSVNLSGQTSILEGGAFSVKGSGFSEPVTTNETRLYTGALQLEAGKNVFYLLTTTSFSIIDIESSNPVKTIAEIPFMEWPALVDFDDDGRTDILYVDQTRRQLIAKHATGALLNFFPISAPKGSRFTGTPLVADIEGDGSQDIIITVQDSISMNLYAYDQQGKKKEAFPLFAGSVAGTESQPVHPAIQGQTLYSVSHTGELKAWKFPLMGDVLWRSRYGNEPFNKVTGRISDSVSPQIPPGILVKEETYNWPNPASEITNIRYQLNSPGNVEIKIITPGGRVVYDKSFDASGGRPEEQQIATSDWGNGIYFAVITATVNGQKARQMIKIAVVH